MRDCAMIKFGEFAGGTAGTGPAFHVPVWRRRTVSAALGLSEHQLVEFCILLGCDFTASRDLHNNYADYRTSFEGESAPAGAASGQFELEGGTFGFKAFSCLLSQVRAQGSTFCLCAVEENVPLQLAIRYSRAFFNLDTTSMGELTSELVIANALIADLEELGVDADGEPAEEAELLDISDTADEEVDFTIRVPEDLEVAFLAWLRTEPPRQYGQCAVKLLQYCTALHGGTIEMPPGQTQETLPLQPEHIMALRETMRIMQAPDRVFEEHPHSPMAVWETVVAGKVYQDLLYRALREHFPIDQVCHVWMCFFDLIFVFFVCNVSFLALFTCCSAADWSIGAPIRR